MTFRKVKRAQIEGFKHCGSWVVPRLANNNCGTLVITYSSILQSHREFLLSGGLYVLLGRTGRFALRKNATESSAP